MKSLSLEEHFFCMNLLPLATCVKFLAVVLKSSNCVRGLSVEYRTYNEYYRDSSMQFYMLKLFSISGPNFLHNMLVNFFLFYFDFLPFSVTILMLIFSFSSSDSIV